MMLIIRSVAKLVRRPINFVGKGTTVVLLANEFLPLVEEEDEILPSHEALLAELLHIALDTCDVTCGPSALGEIVARVSEPPVELLIGILCETLEPAVLEVLQDPRSEEGGVVVGDSDEAHPLDLLPILRKVDVLTVDADLAVDEIEIGERVLDCRLHEIGMIHELHLHVFTTPSRIRLLREPALGGCCVGALTADDPTRSRDVWEEEVDITATNETTTPTMTREVILGRTADE